MFSATAITVVVGLVVSPITLRLYSPAAYGVFGVFNGFVTNVTMVFTLAYPSAFLLPRVMNQFYALVYLSMLLATANFGLVTLALLLMREVLLRWLRIEALGNWMYAVPATALVYNLMLIMNAWHQRNKESRKQPRINVVTSLSTRALTLGAGVLLHGSATGLLLGEMFSKVVGMSIVFFSGIHRQVRGLARAFSWVRVRVVAYEYREFPLYIAPGSYLNTLALQLPMLLFTSLFGATAVGPHVFSTSLLELPISLIGTANSPVFQQKATETHARQPTRLLGLCLDLYNKLLYLGLVPFGIISVYGDWIFRFAFGARWEAAGVFTAHLGYSYTFRLTSYATSPVYMVLRRQRLALWGVLLLVVTQAASLGVGIYLHSINVGMILFGLSSLLVTFSIDMNILYLLGLSGWRVALRSIGLVTLTLILLYAVRLSLQHLFNYN